MAGLGRKDFQAGAVLSAADVDGYLMDQTVMKFANTAAAGSAYGTAIAEGMNFYLSDTDEVVFHTGSAFSKQAGENLIANGDFHLNSRGFTSRTDSTYGHDRWFWNSSGGTGTYSTQAFTAGTAPVAGYESTNYARLAITTGNDFTALRQNIDDVRTFAGQTVTLSFWAKGTNPTTEGGLYAYSTQTFGTGGSSSVTVTSSKFVLTASWTRYSLTLNIPSIAGKTIGPASHISVAIGQAASTSADSWTFDLWGVQLESGSVASSFKPAGGNTSLDTVASGSAGFDGVLVATGSSSNGSGSGTPAWAGYDVAGKNKIINGGFDVFQRSTFASQTASNYSLDRWYASVGGTVTITQQTTGVPVGAQYCMRVAYNASSSFANTRHAISSDLVSTLKGQIVTLSAKVRRNASFAANLSMNLYKNATADTQSGGSWTSISSTLVANASLPTGTTSADWYTVTATVAIPNDGTANGLRVEFGESAAGSSGQYYEVANVQLEAGSVATPFSRAGGTLQGELAACQRYYWRQGGDSTYQTMAQGIAYSTTQVEYAVRFPVTMRITPTSIDFSTIAVQQQAAGALYAITATANLNGNAGSKDGMGLAATIGSASLTTGQTYLLKSNGSTSGYLGFSAEL